MTYHFTPSDLTKIIAQDGYSVADGSLWDEATVTEAKRPTVVKPATWRNEHEFQAAVFAEAAIRAILRPEYAMLMAIPNGQVRPNQRKEAGIKRGAPDIFLAVQRGGHGGWFCELKIGSNKPSQDQRTVLQALRMEGYRCVTIWDSVEDVMNEIEDYLSLGR